jgi:ADP-ribosylglycohydrolase
MFGPPDRHRFVFRRGMVSDDTEHACMVLQSLIASGGDDERFLRYLASRLRMWLFGVPAGIGLATLKATLKLCVGFSPEHSGVFSAGNGPAMRSVVLGAAVEDRERLRRLVRASTRITHTDPKAEYGAMAAAVAARMAAEGQFSDGARCLDEMRRLLVDDEAGELLSLLERAVSSVDAGETSQQFADSLGFRKGISGYIYHTVPAAIHASLRNPNDLRGAIMEIVSCGGDTDTTGAVVGGIVGAQVGPEGLPEDWLTGLCEWPRTVAWMRGLAVECAGAISSHEAQRSPRLPLAGLLARNAIFTVVVLSHGFRRLLPPY